MDAGHSWRRTRDHLAPAQDLRSGERGQPLPREESARHIRQCSTRRRAAKGPAALEIELAVPKQFDEAQRIADAFGADCSVVVNMQDCQQELATRLLDFCSGLAYARDGGLQRIEERVYLLAPHNVEITAETILQAKGFFNQL